MKLLSGNSCWSISNTEVLPKPSPHSGPFSLTLGFLSPVLTGLPGLKTPPRKRTQNF